MSLDGVHVWVTLDSPADGQIVAVESEGGRRTAFSPPVVVGKQTVLLPIAELPDRHERTFHLVFQVGGEETERPLVRQRPLNAPTQTPISPDSRLRYRINDHPNGFELRPVMVPQGTRVLRLVEERSAVVIEWDADAGHELVVLDDDKNEVVSVSATVLDGRASARLGAGAAVPLGSSYDVGVRDSGCVLPLIRVRNDLVRPDAAVLLPESTGDGVRLRLQWSRNGTLRLVSEAH